MDGNEGVRPPKYQKLAILTNFLFDIAQLLKCNYSMSAFHCSQCVLHQIDVAKFL